MAFIGISIAMGMLRLPRVKDYWSTTNVLSTPWFRSIMSRDRFLDILRYIHLVDSSQQKKKGEGFDPLFKIRPLVDHLNAVFPEYYKPSRYLSIDEMMIGTRCRVAFLQYIPKKPTRFGIKVWVNSEAKTSYVLCFQVYTGATGSENGKTKTTGLGYRVVMDLMERYRMKGHCLFVDNFYTSPQLLNDLLVAGTYCTGTARSNRKDFPKEIVPTKSNLPSGAFRFAIAKLLGNLGKIVAVWWRDQRYVLALSTMHNTSATTVLKRPKGGHEKRPIPCPTIIDDYNQYMGGVDLTDQNLSYYSMTNRKTLKWWKKVFWRFIDICIINSWIIFRHNNLQSPIKHSEFSV